jgi:hypothetical protein
MSTQIQRRRGTTAEHSTFTGVEGELTVDTTKDTAIVHDGTTVGGHPLQKQYPPLGSAAAPTYTFTGDTNTGIYSPGADQVAVATNGTGRLFVDASGNVGVGTGSPASILEANATVSGSNFIGIRCTDSTNTKQIQIFRTGSSYSYGGIGGIEGALFANSTLNIVADSNGSIKFNTGNAPTERLRITSAGNVGIGTSAPNTKLEIRGDSAGSVVELVKLNNNAVIGSGKGVRLGFGLSDSPAASSRAYIEAVLDGSNKTYLAFATNNGSGVFERARLDGDGRLLVGTSSSYTGYNFQVEGTTYGSSGGTFKHNANSAATGAVIKLIKSRGTSVGSSTIVQNDDRCGNIIFAGTDGSGDVTAASIEGFVDGTPGANDMPGRLVFSTTADGASSPTERLRIASSGRVGIGNNSPALKLHVEDSGSQVVRWARTGVGAGSLDVDASGNAVVNAHTSSTGIAFHLQASEKARIDSSGRLLVGTSSAYDVAGGTGYTPSFQVVGSTAQQASALVAHTDGEAYIVLANLGGGSVVSNNELLGVINFKGNDGNSYPDFASIAAFVDGTPGDNDCPGRLTFSTTADGGISLTERMRIDSSGRVGIGTASPISRLNTLGTQGNWRIDPDSVSGEVQSYITNVANTNFIDYRIRTNQTIFNTGGSERARIDSSGRLLVGTSSGFYSTTVKLQGNNASSTDESRIRLCRGTASPANGDTLAILGFSDNTETPSAEIAAQRDGGTWSASSVPGRLTFSTTADGASSPTERMRISSDGAFRCFAANTVVRSISALGAGTSEYLYGGYHSGTNTVSGTTSFAVFTNGNVVNTNNSYGALSDLKLKENIVDATSQWADIKALQVRKYNFKEGQTHTQIGLIAQEAELVSPGIVSESPDRDEDGNDLGTVTKSVNYSVLYMKAVKALQEAMERIETLEGMAAVNNITIDEQQHQLATLAARLTALESA